MVFSSTEATPRTCIFIADSVGLSYSPWLLPIELLCFFPGETDGFFSGSGPGLSLRCSDSLSSVSAASEAAAGLPRFPFGLLLRVEARCLGAVSRRDLALSRLAEARCASCCVCMFHYEVLITEITISNTNYITYSLIQI